MTIPNTLDLSMPSDDMTTVTISLPNEMAENLVNSPSYDARLAGVLLVCAIIYAWNSPQFWAEQAIIISKIGGEHANH